MTDEVVSVKRPGRHQVPEGEVIHHTPGFPPMLSGMSTNDYTKLLYGQQGFRRWSHEAKGKILMFPRTGIIAVPFEMTGGGWNCVTLHDPSGTYPPSGYNIHVGEDEIQTAVEFPIDWSKVWA